MGIEVFDCEQGSEEWFNCRLGIPTASEFKSVLAKGEGKTRRAYMMKLLGERLTGEICDKFNNAHMERGHALEGQARDFYARTCDLPIKQVGFIRNGDVGCSPDALVGNDGLLEIKTKLPHLQLEVLLAGRMPAEHVAQCQGALWVSGRQWIDFVSCWPRLPYFVIRSLRDEPYIERLAAEVDKFKGELDEHYARMQELPVFDAVLPCVGARPEDFPIIEGVSL